MIRFIRTIFVGLLVASLAASGATTAHAKITDAKIADKAETSSHSAHGAMQHHHQEMVSANDEHCPHASVSQHGDAGQRDSHDANACKNCCVACIIHGVIPELLVAVPASIHRNAIYQPCKVLSGLIASADPGIPKR